jgi:hypothetical protein
MRSLTVWILGLFALWAGFQSAARLQRWESATLFAECGKVEPCLYEGAVRREFRTGDYVVSQADASEVVVSADRLQGMSWQATGGVGIRSMAAGLAGLLLFGLLTLGDALGRFRSATSRAGGRGVHAERV